MPRPLSPGRLLLRTLEETATPLLVLDNQRRIVFASRSLGEWAGVDAERLVGLRCDYHTGGDVPLTSVAAALCPPPEAFTGTVASGSVGRPALANRPSEQRPARFVTLSGKSAAEGGLLLVVVQPPQELPAAETLAAPTPERLHALLADLRGQLGKRFSIGQLIGESHVMHAVREQVRVAAETRARVLVVGPQGSGREHVARTIHHARQAPGPLVPIACALADAEQMQRLLAGVLRQVEPGEQPAVALLLDVDRLSKEAQQELAGFLQFPHIELHTLATAGRPLSRLVTKGKFRADLALVLGTLTIRLPGLARRRRDIPLLAQHFLEEANAAGGPQRAGFLPAALERLLALPWPGNIDQLAAAVREACERAAGPRIAPADLPDWIEAAESAAQRTPRDDESIRLDELLEQIEREILERALRKARGNKSKAAELLGVNRNRLLRRLAQFGLIEPAAAEEPVVFEPLPEQEPAPPSQKS